MDEQDSRPEESPELARLRGLGAWMRSVGATELSLGDLHIKLSPSHPAASGQASGAIDHDESAALADEAREVAQMSAEERAHRRYWARIVRSSGAPIPPFRPSEDA